jgi:predicted HTH transcriptional regulator
MPSIRPQEDQSLEFKRQWTDKPLEDLAAFANTEGGTILVGIREDGEIVGAAADDREVQRLANLISSRLGITQQGLPEPEFAEWQGGVRVTFAKDPYTPERLRAMRLSERQVRAVLYVKEQGCISNREYQVLIGVSKRTASRDLDNLVQMGILERVGATGKGTRYVLKVSEGGQRGQNGSQRGQRGKVMGTENKMPKAQADVCTG